MEVKKAFEIMFGFDVTNFAEAYENSRMGGIFGSLQNAWELKTACNTLKEEYGWKENFVIYKHGNRGFSVDVEDPELEMEGLELVC